MQLGQGASSSHLDIFHIFAACNDSAAALCPQRKVMFVLVACKTDKPQKQLQLSAATVWDIPLILSAAALASDAYIQRGNLPNRQQS